MIVSKDNATFAEIFVKDINLNNRTEYINVVTHKGHKFDVKNGKYELRTAIILSNNGYFVEMMNEPSRRLQYDMKVNNTPSEIKVMSGFRNIRKRAVEASEQGASRIVYYIGFDNAYNLLALAPFVMVALTVTVPAAVVFKVLPRRKSRYKNQTGIETN